MSAAAILVRQLIAETGSAGPVSLYLIAVITMCALGVWFRRDAHVDMSDGHALL